MTDKDIIERVAKLLNGKVKHTIREKHYKDVYSTAIFSNKAAGWMMTLYSLMGERRKARIQETLDHWKQQRFKNPKGLGRLNPRSLAERKQNEAIINRHRD